MGCTIDNGKAALRHQFMHEIVAFHRTQLIVATAKD